MKEISEFLGFVSLSDTIWNIVGYVAFLGIIIGVLFEKYRNILFVVGAVLLAFYAELFLHNTLFTILQILIAISGTLKLVNVPQRSSVAIMVPMTVVAYLLLIFSKSLVDVWAILGSFGLLGIAFGIVRLPKLDGFLIMTTGGVLLVAYGFVVEAWVFFFLNIFFSIANIRTWYVSHR